MIRHVCLFVVFCLPLACTNLVNESEQFDYDRDTPPWLKTRIEQMEVEPTYMGTVIYRYDWHGAFVYDIKIPINSCAYCEVYNQQGHNIDLTNEKLLQDFFQNKRNEVLVWEWIE